jgi:hypothetical protein
MFISELKMRLLKTEFLAIENTLIRKSLFCLLIIIGGILGGYFLTPFVYLLILTGAFFLGYLELKMESFLDNWITTNPKYIIDWKTGLATVIQEN